MYTAPFLHKILPIVLDNNPPATISIAIQVGGPTLPSRVPECGTPGRAESRRRCSLKMNKLLMKIIQWEALAEMNA